MKVLVIGAGVIGVTTAYFLAKSGAQVTVIEREPSTAMQCSYSNGAQLSYSHAEPWANWSNVLKGIKWMSNPSAPLLLRPRIDIDMYKWIFKFMLNCSKSNIDRNTHALLNLAFYSRKVMHSLNEEVKIDFNYTQKGILHIFRKKEEVKDMQDYITKLAKMEPFLKHEMLNRRKCIELDPALENLMRKRSGGVLCHNDELGDIYEFCKGLESECKKLGVVFKYNTEMQGFNTAGHVVQSVITDKGDIECNSFVMCTGAYSAHFLRPIGIDLPVYPMKGYSISARISGSHTTPHVSVTDHQKKIVFSRIGNIFRAAGTAEFAGFDHTIPQERIDPLIKSCKSYFPDAADYNNLSIWSCLRPQTPRSYPFLGKTRKYKNLFVNMGHGSLGWTQAVGSAKAVADLVIGREPEIDMSLYKA
jgi:D-amino-acid dehydrogenase